MKRITQIAFAILSLIGALLLGPTPVAAEADVADLLVSDRRLTILEETLSQAGLLDELGSAGPFTLVAPTDHAFDALAGELAAVPSSEVIAALLTEQVTAGFTVADLLWLSQEAWRLAESESIVVDGNTLQINDTHKVIIAERLASNGVLYIVDVEAIPETALPSRDYPLKSRSPQFTSLGADLSPLIVANWPEQPDYRERYWARADEGGALQRMASRNYPLAPATTQFASLGADLSPLIVADWPEQPDYRESYWTRAFVEPPKPTYHDGWRLAAAPSGLGAGYLDTFRVTASLPNTQLAL